VPIRGLLSLGIQIKQLIAGQNSLGKITKMKTSRGVRGMFPSGGRRQMPRSSGAPTISEQQAVGVTAAAPSSHAFL